MYIFNFITEFISKKFGKEKKSMFIQFITLGLFVGATVITYIPRDTDPLMVVGAIFVFWIIIYIIFRILQFLKIL